MRPGPDSGYRVPRLEVARLLEALVLSEGVWCEDRDVVTAAGGGASARRPGP